MGGHTLQYWEALMVNWQKIDFDVGSIIMKYFMMIIHQRERKKKCNHEFYSSLKEMCCNGKYRVNRNHVGDFCLRKKNLNMIRELLSVKIGKSKEEMFVSWMTPIDKIHSPKIYIAGILGTDIKTSIQFRAPYSLLLKICEENGWEKPQSIESWSGEERNIRALMFLESGVIEV